MRISVTEAAKALKLTTEQVIERCEDERLFAIQENGIWILDSDYLAETFPAEVWVFPDPTLGPVAIFIASEEIRLFYKMHQTRESYFDEHYDTLKKEYHIEQEPFTMADVVWEDIEKYPDMVDVAYYSKEFCEEQHLEFTERYPRMYRGYPIETPDFVDLFLEEEMMTTESFVLSENFIGFEKGYRLYRVLKYGDSFMPGLFMEIAFEQQGLREVTLLGTKQQIIDNYKLTTEQANELEDL
ncbi:hypothetical protein QI30_16885 [Kurthia sp. 3B1D]|uniref:Uncharacterized protein n=1 Tax=Candidatus Kurthia intestinigallinarum TaxID=1562256 RepID=A0A433RQ37_9BACL|nr:hypothetical protein [Kurthia sp. 3B1D]RUS52440.1 hypothetical protein QI30_16885 [Kurthia sp. 3B1D]